MEVNRNNQLYHSIIQSPLIFEYEHQFKDFDKYFGGFQGVDGRIVVITSKSKKDFLICFDICEKEIVWQLECEEASFPFFGDENSIYLLQNDLITSLDPNTGTIQWQCQEFEYLQGSSADHLFSINEADGDITLICRSRKNGSEVWRLKDLFKELPFNVAVDNGIIALRVSDQYYFLSEAGGEIICQFNISELLRVELPDTNFIKKTSFGLEIFQSMGPLVEGVLYIGVAGGAGEGNTGHLIAVDARTGAMLWAYDLKLINKPGTIIYNKERVYFDIDGLTNYLTCLDAQSGELVFRTDENFTPAGSNNPIISNNYFIAGSGQYLSFFDLDKQEFIWRYKHKKNTDVFRSNKYVYNDRLITCDIETNTVYWFKNRV